MLAQEWLYGRRVTTKYDSELERMLKLPTKFNPLSTVAVLNNIAERVVFTDDVPSLLYEMHDNRQLTYNGVLKSAKLPFDCFWLEYPSAVGLDIDELKYARYGALVKRTALDRVRMYVVIGMVYKDNQVISTLSHVIDFDCWPPLQRNEAMGGDSFVFTVVYAYNREDLFAEADFDGNGTHTHQLDLNETRSRVGELGNIISELIFGIFLITQPRVYSTEDVVFKDSHKRARAAANKPPLLEYRKIHVRIGRPTKRYDRSARSTTHTEVRGADRIVRLAADDIDTESDVAKQHRRYHKVMGHFRHYENEKTTKTVWIEPHYRGDPAVGVTFTERDVSK